MNYLTTLGQLEELTEEFFDKLNTNIYQGGCSVQHKILFLRVLKQHHTPSGVSQTYLVQLEILNSKNSNVSGAEQVLSLTLTAEDKSVEQKK